MCRHAGPATAARSGEGGWQLLGGGVSVSRNLVSPRLREPTCGRPRWYKKATTVQSAVDVLTRSPTPPVRILVVFRPAPGRVHHPSASIPSATSMGLDLVSSALASPPREGVSGHGTLTSRVSRGRPSPGSSSPPIISLHRPRPVLVGAGLFLFVDAGAASSVLLGREGLPGSAADNPVDDADACGRGWWRSRPATGAGGKDRSWLPLGAPLFRNTLGILCSRQRVRMSRPENRSSFSFSSSTTFHNAAP
mmetsp:Transcript_86132/g.243294  ORF Transcript_86132/g.243294 Transcript_86132/m.243294 type:complete len:250 (-) Transcript_86132:171-920(-)